MFFVSKTTFHLVVEMSRLRVAYFDALSANLNSFPCPQLGKEKDKYL